MPWRRPHWVAAKVAGQLREGVLLDCGASTHHQPRRLSTVSLGPVDPADDRLVEDDDPAVELAELLAWACAEDVITDEDRELLVSLIEAAKTLQADGQCPRGRSGRPVEPPAQRRRGPGVGRVCPHRAASHRSLLGRPQRSRRRVPQGHLLTVHQGWAGPVRDGGGDAEMTSTPADVAALLKIAAMEPETLDDLDGCLRRLRDVQKARRELAKVPPAMLLSGLLDRRPRGGDPS